MLSPAGRGHTYFHVPPDEGLRDPQHVGVLHQLQQVLPQLLLVLGDFSQLYLELLQLLLQQHSCRESRLSRGSLLTPVTQAHKGHSAGKEPECKCASQGPTARFTSSSQFMVRTTTPAGCSDPSTCRSHMMPPRICCCQPSFRCLSTPHTNLYFFCLQRQQHMIISKHSPASSFEVSAWSHQTTKDVGFYGYNLASFSCFTYSNHRHRLCKTNH